jgi:hypothetical protein
MKDLVEICGGKRLCTSPIIIACSCNNSVVFLCRDCATEHFLEPRPHLFIPLEQARQITPPVSAQKCQNFDDKMIRIKIDVERYIIRLIDFKARILSLKQEVYRDLEENVDLYIQKIDSMLNHTYTRLEDLEISMQTFEISHQEILDKYEHTGIKGVIDEYIDILSLNYHDIKQAIRSMITIDKYSNTQKPLNTSESSCSPVQTSIPLSEQALTGIPQPSQVPLSEEINSVTTTSSQLSVQPQPDSSSLPLASSRYIFHPKNGTSDLIKYNIDLNTIEKYSLSLYHSFQNSAICTLPDGSVLVSGGQTSNSFFRLTHGETYKVELSYQPPKITQMGDLNFPRSNSRLVCHREYVYIFGGWNETTLDKAERMKIGEDSWEILPEMREAREDFGVYTTRNRIYCIGGFSNTTVEYFDIRLHSFRRFVKVVVPAGGIVCGEIDNRLYTVGRNRIEVYTKKFRMIESRECEYDKHTYCYSESWVKDRGIIYVDFEEAVIYRCDLDKNLVQKLSEIKIEG